MKNEVYVLIKIGLTEDNITVNRKETPIINT